MSKLLTVEQIIEAANHLSREDRQRLIESLRQELPQKRRITELRGLGKEIWQQRDAQQYVDAERDAWES